ncbi:MBL fold metallo-hydrolase [Pelomyxa schiedti]|nr:MBL fold metallo-hydrolase [Pelomyxa schiedti]
MTEAHTNNNPSSQTPPSNPEATSHNSQEPPPDHKPASPDTTETPTPNDNSPTTSAETTTTNTKPTSPTEPPTTNTTTPKAAANTTSPTKKPKVKVAATSAAPTADGNGNGNGNGNSTGSSRPRHHQQQQQQQPMAFGIAGVRAQGSPFREWREIELWPGVKGEGYSRAADSVFLFMPSLDAAFECGTSSGRQPHELFITHTHADHARNVAYECKRGAQHRAKGRSGVLVYVPKPAVPLIHAFLKAEIEMSNCCEFDERIASPYEIIGLSPGDVRDMDTCGGNAYSFEVFECIHTVPCIGYGIMRKAQKLKAEYQILSGVEIAKLRKNGVEVSGTVTTPIFAFLGDTHPSIFDKNPRIFDYPTIMCECTFITDDDSLEENADKYGHCYWSQLRHYVSNHKQTRFILHHFSLRYTTAEIRDFFQLLAQKGELDNVSLFLCDRGDAF